MQPSVFRRLQFATFAFLSLIVVALVISAALTALEIRQLRDASPPIVQRRHRARNLSARALTGSTEPAAPRRSRSG